MRPVPGRAWARTSRSTGIKCSFSLVGARECVEGCDYLMFGRMRPERRSRESCTVPEHRLTFSLILLMSCWALATASWRSVVWPAMILGGRQIRRSPPRILQPIIHAPSFPSTPMYPAPDRVPYPPHGQEQTLGIHPIQANRAAPCLSALRPGACSASHPVHWTRMFNAPQCYRSPISVGS